MLRHLDCVTCKQAFGSSTSLEIHAKSCDGQDKAHYDGLRRCEHCRLWLVKSSTHNCKGRAAPDPTFAVVEQAVSPKSDTPRLVFTTAAINLDGPNFTTPGVTVKWVGSQLLPAFLDAMKPGFVFASEANAASHFKKEGYGKYEGNFTGGDRYAFIWNMAEWQFDESSITLGDRDVTFVVVHKDTKYVVGRKARGAIRTLTATWSSFALLPTNLYPISAPAPSRAIRKWRGRGTPRSPLPSWASAATSFRRGKSSRATASTSSSS
jgi:hypothetical protein